jgi:thioredoxin-like negative regulator of GroEL
MTTRNLRIRWAAGSFAFVSRPLGRRFALGVVALVVTASLATAQPVRWRYDYNAARHEAQEKSLPLILDFGTENCFWCRKLDETTFQEPAIANTLNQQFIPLKVDAHQNPLLTEALRVQSFPTLVLAAPDGKILGTLEGYLEAPRLNDHLQRALASLNNPEWMTRDYEEAARAVAKADYARAVALLKSVLEDGKKRPVQVKAGQLLTDLEQQSAGRLDHAKQLVVRGQTTEAIDKLTELLRLYAGTQAATEGGQMLTVLASNRELQLQERSRRARELLAQAREEYRSREYLGCMERCEVLSSTFKDLPEGAEAGKLLAEIKSNPEWMKQACDTLSERLATLYLSMAETWIKKGQTQEAVRYLQRVLQASPGTRQAELAQTRLAQLQGQPTRSINFKGP